jgi:hypothetical protein
MNGVIDLDMDGSCGGKGVDFVFHLESGFFWEHVVKIL